MRFLIAAAAGLAALLLLPAAAGAAGLAAAAPKSFDWSQALHRAPSGHVRAGDLLGARPGFHPLAAVLGLAGIGGYVRDTTGSGVSGAAVEWYGPGDTDYGMTLADGSGHYSFSGLPALTGTGKIIAYPDTTGLASIWTLYGLSWTDPGPTGFDFNPGTTPLTCDRSGFWNDWSSARLTLWGTDTQGELLSKSTMLTGGDTATTPVSGSVAPLAGLYSGGTVNFWSNEGVELDPLSLTVTAGGTSSAVSADEADAQRMTVQAPYWASGKPGSKVTLAFDNYPDGWSNDVTGYPDYPATTARHDFGDVVMTVPNQTRAVTVPSDATPGYDYYIGAQHDDGLGLLYLETPFQVCTLKATKTTIHQGASIVVSGVVPVAGHWGSTLGTATKVMLFAHSGTVSVPHTWTPGKGWQQAKAVKTDRKGAWHTGKLFPQKTLTLVARYPTDSYYLGAYTSALNIRVK